MTRAHEDDRDDNPRRRTRRDAQVHVAIVLGALLVLGVIGMAVLHP
jgi:hypothetical protein